ncbi:FMN-binding protein [uncultured Clostridium sp.]|uniref:FMN-binding protein n=1 Tax=uncultured Clostridium sp. TaxID=59620 RepID=UPI00258C1F52|nr:FMN-binding protein [uncultured Clostridium sp.]
MKTKKLKMIVSTLAIIIIAGIFTGCAKEEKIEEKADATTQSSEGTGSVTDLEWDAQPTLGLIKGDYYKVEERFRQGHLGVLEVVKNDGKIVEVEFNEMTRPNYYKRYYQNVPKRNSEYNFDMGAAKGAAWIQSVVQVEKQMIDEQRLTGEFDVVSGASNSIEQAMVPLAEKINVDLENPSGMKYYAIAEELGGGLTGKLKVIVQDGKIIECRYDEIFANSPDDIEDPALKKYYRVSKYESIEYHEPSRIGFNVQMDELNKKVVETQDMLDLTGLPAIEATGDYKSSGYTERNTAWDNYLKLAEKLLNEMKADKVL